MRYVEIGKEAIPYTIEIRLAGTTYALTFHYNAEADFFAVDLALGGEVLAAGAKLVYGQPLFAAYADARFPSVALVPWDIAGKADAVTWDTLGRDVLLYVIE